MNKLPDGWTEYKLKDIMSISSKRYNPNKDTKNYKCIELEHIESETGILNGHTNSKDIHSVKNVFEKGEVLYGKLRPYLKKFYLAKFDGVCSSEIWVLKGKKVINDFLYYFIQQDNFNYIANVSIGMIMPRADWSYMSEISFNIPPLDEQKRIAAALSKIDAYLENTIKLIEKKERFKRGIAKKLLTCKEGENIPEARFKGFEDEWKTKTLENICKNIKTGKLNANAMEKDGQYRFYTCAKDYYKINTYAFDGEAILISGNGAHVGYVHYYNGKFNAYQRTYVLMDFTENILFIKYYLDIHLKYKINIENNKGNIPYIVLNTIKDMEIKFPSLEEQEKIGGYLSLLDAEIDNLKKQKELIKEMKRGAMQKLLSGEVRLLE